MFSTFTVVAALAALAAARNCANLTIPVSITGRNAVFNLATPQTNIDITNFILNQSRQGHNLTAELLTGVSSTSSLLTDQY